MGISDRENLYKIMENKKKREDSEKSLKSKRELMGWHYR